MKSDPTELRRKRQLKGHTGRSLALAAGVSQPRISELEGAAIPVRPTTARRLAEALGCEIAEITTLEADAGVAS